MYLPVPVRILVNVAGIILGWGLAITIPFIVVVVGFDSYKESLYCKGNFCVGLDSLTKQWLGIAVMCIGAFMFLLMGPMIMLPLTLRCARNKFRAFGIYTRTNVPTDILTYVDEDTNISIPVSYPITFTDRQIDL